jgi:hypothetical protein
MTAPHSPMVVKVADAIRHAPAERVISGRTQNALGHVIAEKIEFVVTDESRARAALAVWPAEKAIDLLRSFVQHCPEPQLVSMGFDSPPEFATENDHQLAYTLHLAHALLAKLDAAL